MKKKVCSEVLGSEGLRCKLQKTWYYYNNENPKQTEISQTNITHNTGMGQSHTAHQAVKHRTASTWQNITHNYPKYRDNMLKQCSENFSF